MRPHRLLSTFPILAVVASAALADGPALPRIELNRADPAEGVCRLVFVAENPGAVTVDELSVEAVLFNREGHVVLLTLLDMGELPAGRMRVRSFDMAGLDCDELGRLLINDTSCQPSDACADGLVWSSATGIEVRE